jgi:proteic killer suppression protein
MIASFKDREAERIFNQTVSRRLPRGIQKRALNKLLMLHAAKGIQDLRNPPSNNLEALGGDRQGQYSIRINDQYRICFLWADSSAHEVEIIDYH